ncbi:SusD/RagB family nutrient-binding outer membrane lipoprotein [Spirosoma arcticum]
MKASCSLALLFAVGSSSCQPFVRDYDVSPNLAEQAPLGQRLMAIEAAVGLSAAGELPRLGGIWTGQFTGQVNQYDAFENYVAQASDFDGAWQFIYVGIGANARLTQQEATAVADPWTAGVAQVLEVWAVGTLTDLFGDVPYTQAFQPDTYPSPVFDPQPMVYATLQTTLDEAVTNLTSPTGGNLKTSDFFYQGDLAKWRAVAHSLKARYYLHTKAYDKAIVEALVGIASPSDDWVMPFPGTANGVDKNPYWDFSQIQRTGYLNAAGAYAVGLLKNRTGSKTDETGRLNFYYNPAANDLNYTEGGFGGASTGFPILSYAENQLLLAECYSRLGQANQALTALNAVRAANAANPSYQRFGPVRYQPYVAGDFPTADALLKEIMTEKYLTLLGQLEVYNDARRTTNAALIGIPLKVTSAPRIPQRLFVPQSELSTNLNAPKQSPSDLFVPTAVNR